MNAQTISIHPAVDRVIQLVSVDSPQQAAAAVRSIQVLAGKLLSSPTAPECLWTSSALARTGFPLEFAFVSNDSSLRITTEVTGPEIPPTQRLEHAETLFNQLNPTPLPEELSHFFFECQQNHELKYGAWLGSRFKKDNPQAQPQLQTTYKIYIEIPCDPENSPAVKKWLEGVLPAQPVTFNRQPPRQKRLRMIGYNGDSHWLELYFDTPSLQPYDLYEIMAPVGLQDQVKTVLDSLFQAYQRPVQWELPGSDWGFSYALPYTSTQTKKTEFPVGKGVFSLYTFANALFGGDHSIRAAILDLARRQGWSSTLYETISEPLANKRGFITHHGVFGIVLSPQNPPAFTFGLTPP